MNTNYDTRYLNRHIPTIDFGKFGMGFFYWKYAKGIEWCVNNILGVYKNKHEPIEDEC